MSAIQRPLSAAEAALADRVFGKALDCTRVRIVGAEHWVSILARKFGRDAQVVVRGSKIFWPDLGKGTPDDFCAEGPAMSSVLVHELAHVWQYQKGYLTGVAYVLSFNWRYTYTLNNDRRFLDYGYEQQASMIEDYARLTLGLPARHAGHMVSAAALRSLMPFREKALQA